MRFLYENQAIYIVSSVGNQSKETFTKIEEIVLRIGKTAAFLFIIYRLRGGSIQRVKNVLKSLIFQRFLKILFGFCIFK